MADGGYLVPPTQDATKEAIWTETKKRLDRFLPDLFKEIFPGIPAEKSPVSAVTTPDPSSATELPNDEKSKQDQTPVDPPALEAEVEAGNEKTEEQSSEA